MCNGLLLWIPVLCSVIYIYYSAFQLGYTYFHFYLYNVNCKLSHKRYDRIGYNTIQYISGDKFEHLWINVDSSKIWESNCLTLLGVHIDSSLKFHRHEIFRMMSWKLPALTRLAKMLPIYLLMLNF